MKYTAKGLFLLILTATALMSTASTRADNHAVIVNRSNSITSIDKEFLASIYLGRTILWENGERIKPGMIAVDSPSIKSFLKAVCSSTTRRFNAHWMKQIFSGSGIRPLDFSSSENAIRYIVSHPNAIAIVDGSSNLDKVKHLKIID